MAKQAAIVIFAYGMPKHKKLRSRGLDLARLLVEKANVKPYVLLSCASQKTARPGIRCI
jgi:hypothetical protein